jgi:1,4-alpha-glucan branching enzyme
MKLTEDDKWLEPAKFVIEERYSRFLNHCEAIVKDYGSIYSFAGMHNEMGFHYDAMKRGWYFRDWLPRAKEVYLFGSFNSWEPCQYPLTRKDNGVWEIFLPDDADNNKRVLHNENVLLNIKSAKGWSQHLPAYTTYAVQDPITKSFTAVVWDPETPFDWDGDPHLKIDAGELFIYECHIGMAQEYEGVGSYREFETLVIPHIKSLGYNAVQIMAIAEHPYYGSFGYQVSNFFAPSSRFGTPHELKQLIKTAHLNGLYVIMDVVHSHFANNTLEGLNELDGEEGLYDIEGPAGVHPYWNTKLFDYGKLQVQQFLLSNLRYWMEEYHIDGFRFDGVTSMLYKHHGYIDYFGTLENYFGKDVNNDAITYLMLANTLVHGISTNAITIAEEVSGMPGLARPIADGGMGFDYRMAMAIPDYWIKLLKEQKDEEWNMHNLWKVMNDRIWNVKTVAYCESHDQAIVGDKTIAFRLMDKEMYHSMGKDTPSIVIDRGISLHKLIRLFTLMLGGQAYLNFMGNEFGHPEWIDFPRKENNWSYKYARRQWSLMKNDNLRYSFLLHFDKEIIALAKDKEILKQNFAHLLLCDEEHKTIAFQRGGCIAVFNWHSLLSVPGYNVPVTEPGRYRLLFSSDERRFGGFDRVDKSTIYFSSPCKTGQCIAIYNINRSVNVFEKIEE